MSANFFSKSSQNFLELLDNDDNYYDITIEVGKDPYVRIFRAHMNILCYRSPYLRRILASNNRSNNTNDLVHIRLPNISLEIFQIILKYIYGSILSLNEQQDTSDIYKGFQSDNLLEIQQFCTNLMAKSPEKIFDSFDFTSLPETSLIKLIGRDDLQMKEVEVWEHVLKWGLAQISTLISDPDMMITE